MNEEALHFIVGKPMFFATQADLDRHVVAWHSGYPTKGEVKS